MPRVVDRIFSRSPAILAVFLIGLLAGWRGFDVMLRLLGIGNPDPFVGVHLRTTQYFFSYQEFGFIRRGLFGTLLHPFPALLSRTGLAAVCGLLLVLFAVQFWRFLVSSTSTASPRGRAALAVLCAFMPAFFLRLGWDFGRFDVVDLMAAVASLVLIGQSRWFLASLPAAGAILVHENFIFFSLPLMLAVAQSTMMSQPPGTRTVSWSTLLAAPALASFAVLFLGRSNLTYAELIDHFSNNPTYLRAVPGGTVQHEEISVIARTWWDNFVLNGRMFIEKRAYFHLPIILVWFAFLWRYVTRFYAQNGLRRGILVYAGLSPLLLGVIGFDYYRWFAMAAVNLLIVLVWECRSLARRGASAVIAWDLNAKVLVASALLGPICNTKSFLYPFLVLEKYWPGKIPW